MRGLKEGKGRLLADGLFEGLCALLSVADLLAGRVEVAASCSMSANTMLQSLHAPLS